MSVELTDALKKHAVEELEVPEDANDEAFRKAIIDALDNGDMTAAEFAALSKPEDDPRGQLKELVAEELGPIQDQLSKITEALTKRNGTPTPIEPTPDPADDINERVKEAVERHMKVASQTGLGDATKAVIAAARSPRVKSPIEKYESTKSVAMCPAKLPGTNRDHPMAGQPARLGWNGVTLYHPSQAENALIGAVGKWLMLGLFRQEQRLNEHERQLVQHALHECDWSGCLDGPEGPVINDRRLTDMERRALIDDATSGGTYAVPRVFDDALVLPAVLEGELFPLVEVINLPQGKVVDGSTFTDPTISASVEGTAESLQSTSGMLSNLDTTIYVASGYVSVGLDFESDSPVDFGALLVQRFGIKLKEWLDNQIANGDGTTEPEGIFTKSGTGTSDATNGTSGPVDVNDIEGMLFGLTKAMRASKGSRCAYVMGDATYRYIRSVEVGTADARRIFGMDHEGYTLLNRPVKIQDDITGGVAGFCNLGYYRMFRRLGANFRVTDQGQTLALRNEKMISLRARYGGQLTLAAALHKITDMAIVQA